MRKIITISREFGSGGREIGKRLADYLGISYFDSEIVEELSKQTNLNKNYLDDKLEKGISHYSISFGSSFSRISNASNSAMLLAKQHNVIKKIAAENDCIIIGRGADVALSQLMPFKIFVYADLQSKIARCKSRMSDSEKLSDKDIKKKIKLIDKGRKSTHDLYAPYVWGDKKAYDLCVNTTGLDIKIIVPAIAVIAENYFNNLDI